MTVVGYCWYAGSSVGRGVNVEDGGDGFFLGGGIAGNWDTGWCGDGTGGPVVCNRWLVVLCVFGVVRGEINY